ncbi:MAG: F0F1 ATP synthase subunit gamma [Planctomycetes bacterium]|nr:F0F1 ATP synthase subunit gamma [Planctomycetota bacterium]
MRSIIELKKDILFNREMGELIDILKKTAVSQFQSLFSRKKTLTIPERYLHLMESMFDMINFTRIHHPALVNPVENVMSILITSDMGFLGGVNSAIIDDAMRNIKRNDKVVFFVMGEKGRDYLLDSGKDYDFLPAISDEVKLSEAETVGQYIFSTCIRNKIGRVIITYPKFFSFGHQEIETLQLLPRQKPEPVNESPDAKTSGEEQKDKTASPEPKQMAADFYNRIIYEPFIDRTADYLLRKWLVHRLYDIFWHSKLSEFAARANHLEGSIKELEDIKKALSFQYFRNKREITDRTLRDIFGGKISVNRAKTNN